MSMQTQVIVMALWWIGMAIGVLVDHLKCKNIINILGQISIFLLFFKRFLFFLFFQGPNSYFPIFVTISVT